VGEYDVKWHGSTAGPAPRIYWTGRDWDDPFFGIDNDAWRGLSENPSAPKEAK
jgi:hypothetical protein